MAQAPKLSRIKAQDLVEGDVLFPNDYPAIVTAVKRMRSGQFFIGWEGDAFTIVHGDFIFHVFEHDQQQPVLNGPGIYPGSY